MEKIFFKTILLIMLLMNQKCLAAIRYVNFSAVGADNGTSWASAFTSLQSALDAGVSGDQIWAAKGTYLPTKDPFGNLNPADARDKTFYLKNGVSVYGGFVGTETALYQRVIGNETILSADIGTVGINTDNCYHVMVALNITNSTTIDRMTFTFGNANVASSITINSALIYRQQGGGIYLNASSPVLSNLRLIANNASFQGGAIYSEVNSTPSISKVIFLTNTSTYGGSGIYNKSSNPTLTNVIFDSNFANYYGSAMSNFASSPVLTNAVFVSNTSTYGSPMYNESSSAPSIINGVFYSNSSTYSSGAVYNQNASPTFINVTFFNNFSTYSSGGVENGSSFTTPASQPNFKNCIFWENHLGSSSTLSGADVQNAIGGTTVNTMNISFCSMQLVNNDTNYPTAGFPNIGTNNNLFGLNPSFVNVASVRGDDDTWATSDDGLKIQSASSCNDAGTASGSPLTDITGASRSGNTDIGAYEYASTCPSTLAPTGTITTSQKAAKTVITTGTNTISNSANIIYQAGDFVQLNPGFMANNSSIFIAKVLPACQ